MDQIKLGTATFIKRKDGTGEGRVYRLDPPLAPYEYVWVSATTMPGYPETYIFPSDENGDVVDWGELEGSYKGGLSHEEALRRAGYEVSS